MAGVIKALIVLVISNYSLTFLVIGLLFSNVAIARAKKPIAQSLVVEKLLAWHVFWVVGVNNFYNFVMHSFFGEMSAVFIGWADSPFQFEVATASLGFAVVGFLAAFRSFDLRLAAIVGPSVFTLGAAAGHVYQMVTDHNFAPGNAGVIFYMDLIIPLFGFLLLWLQHRSEHPGTTDWTEWTRREFERDTLTPVGESRRKEAEKQTNRDLQKPIQQLSSATCTRVRSMHGWPTTSA